MCFESNKQVSLSSSTAMGLSVFLVLALATGNQEVFCKSLTQESVRLVNWSPLSLSSNNIQPQPQQQLKTSTLGGSKQINHLEEQTNEPKSSPNATSSSFTTATVSQERNETSLHTFNSNKEPINRLVPVSRQISANQTARLLVSLAPPTAPTSATTHNSSSTNRQQRQQPEQFQTTQDIEASSSYINEMVAPSNEHRRAQAAPVAQQQQQLVAAESSDESQDRESENFDGPEDDSENSGSGDDSPTELARAPSNANSNNNHNQNNLQSVEPSEGPAIAETRRSAAKDSRAYQTGRHNQQQQQQQQHRNQPQEDDESQVRREQEAAEASEAELADRSALDEQQQQQREIILAQAQSEARAIKEQQEALMKQQLLQQQMISRRHHEIEGNRSQQHQVAAHRRQQMALVGQTNNRQQQQQLNAHSRARAHSLERRVQSSLPQSRHYQPQVDIQFSDQPDQRTASSSRVSDLRESTDSNQAASSTRDEVFDYSVRQLPNSLQEVQQQQQQQQQEQAASSNTLDLNQRSTLDGPTKGVESGADSKYDAASGSDLTPAAQHSYGAHYDTIGSNTKNYYQFAESFKKGQFHSGYKRGGKKLQISGHASQHKNHAEGHIKWNGKKGKGSSYWDYQHSPKGSSHYYGGHKDEHYYH